MRLIERGGRLFADPYHAHRTSLEAQYKGHAKLLEVKYGLTRVFFERLIISRCHYCGRPPSQRRRLKHRNEMLAYTGIDRKDNSRGYVPDNVVPCCKVCNKIKGPMSYRAFLLWVRAVWLVRARSRSRVVRLPKLETRTRLR